MKSNTKKRLIAFMLCMVLVLSSTISAFADDLDTQAQDQTTTMAEPTTETQETAENKAQTEQPAAETPVQNTEEAAPQTNDNQSEVAEQPTVSSEENNASNETIECEATQLKQEVDNGNDTKTTVVADIPAGAFHAHASEITMEVKRLSTEDVDDAVIVKLIKNALTTNTSLTTGVEAANASKIIMHDDKLSSLPETGGIGTTIFTIAGCVIMIAAAGLFFASRKKSDNK